MYVCMYVIFPSRPNAMQSQASSFEELVAQVHLQKRWQSLSGASFLFFFGEVKEGKKTVGETGQTPLNGLAWPGLA